MPESNLRYTSVEGRFFAKVDLLDNGCWWWIPTHRDSTGRPRYRQQDAGQWAWIHFKGEYDLKVDGERSHTCSTGKDCVNPEHMKLEKHATNIQRQPNVHTKLNWDIVKAIRADLADMSQSKVAIKYNVSQGTISNIATGKSWKEL